MSKKQTRQKKNNNNNNNNQRVKWLVSSRLSSHQCR